MADTLDGSGPRCGYGHTAFFGGCEECPYVDWPLVENGVDRAIDDYGNDGRVVIRDLLAALKGMDLAGHAALAASKAHEFMARTQPDGYDPLPPVEAPENGETDPEWRAIRRSIDLFVGRVPVVGKHRALNTRHIEETVARLDAAGDHAAADTIVWQCWHRALDRERERFLLDDARQRMAALRAETENP